MLKSRALLLRPDTLYISQSALSQQIRQLEHQLGFQLFDRSTRQVTLTEAGRSFYRNAQQLAGTVRSCAF